MYLVLTTKTFDKNFKKLEKKISDKVINFVVELKNSPVPNGFDIKKMIGGDNEYRCRIGDYRILYKVMKKEIVIVMLDVDHRKDIYK